MARDPNGIIQTRWGKDGDKAPPPFSRDQGWPANYAQPGGQAPARETYNQLWFEITSFAREVNQHGGLLEWDPLINYALPAAVTGSDGNLYRAVVASGPDLSGARDPISEVTAWTRWFQGSPGVNHLGNSLFSVNSNSTPGVGGDPEYVAVNVYAPDGWVKGSTSLLSVTGGVITCTPDGATLSRVDQALDPIFFRGRKITFGCEGSNPLGATVLPAIYIDGAQNPGNAFATGSGLTWEEVTVIVPEDCTDLYVRFYVAGTAGPVGFTKPMLAFGGYIGPDGYAPIPQEHVTIDADRVTLFSGQTISANGVVNLYSATGGKLPASAKSLEVNFGGACANAGKIFAMGDFYDAAFYSQVAGLINGSQGKVRCDPAGVLSYKRDDTFTVAYAHVTEVYL